MSRLLLILSLLLAGCGKEPAPLAGPGKLTLQLNWHPEPQFGGFYAAQLSNAYEKHGLDVTIEKGGPNIPTVEMVGTGKVPFAIVSGDQIVRARAQGNKIVGLFAVYQTNPQGIMTRAARGFQTIEDIFTHEGTLAMERGLPYSDFLEKRFGFSKLKVIPTPFGDLSLYRTDPNFAMQCFVTSEPLAAKKIGVEPKYFLIAEAGYNPYTTVLATSDSYYNSNRPTVKAMVQAVREGWQAYLADPTKANEFMYKLNPGMDPQTFKESAEAQKSLIQSDSPNGSDLGTMTLARWQMLVKQLQELKTIDQPVSAEECFVNSSNLN